MKVKDYLQTSGMTKEGLAQFLGHQSTSSVSKKMEDEMPKRWARLLNEADGVPTAVDGVSDADFDARAHNDSDDWETVGRSGDDSPSPVSDDSVVIGPQQIKLTTVKGYIEQIYGGAELIARKRGDEIAADTIHTYSPQFAEAWITYIESNPAILSYLEKLQIGTPLGNLIGVHAIAVGSYVFARAAAREIGAAFAESERNGNGATVPPTEDFLG